MPLAPYGRVDGCVMIAASYRADRGNAVSQEEECEGLLGLRKRKVGGGVCV